MHRPKPRTTLITLSLASLLCVFVFGGSIRSFAEQTDPDVTDKPVRTQSGGPMFVPPNIANPSRKIDTIRSAVQCAVPLLPANNQMGLTVAEYPTFFVYFPKTTVQTADFILQDENKNEIYKTTFAITGNLGIISLNLPSAVSLPPLEINKEYQWSFLLNCNPQDATSQAIAASGGIRRVEMSPSLAAQLQKATGRDRVAVYAAAGLWYDALATLAELRRANPNDPVLVSDWEGLLTQVGLSEIAKNPLAQP